jgi:zinc transporter, ZIP family
MGGALFWGLVGASSLIVGGAFALRFRISQRSLGLVMGFGSGVLISAVAYELALEAFETSAHTWHVAAGLFAGSFTFFVGDAVIDRLGGQDRKDSDGAQAGGSALAIVLGTVLDGIPESAVIGLGLLQGAGVSAAFVVAVFVSNVPEAIAATTGLARSGWAGRKIVGLWVAVAVVSGLAALAGYAFLDGAGPGLVAFVLSFAGGAVLTMLADTMMPEAFQHGGRLTGVVTTFGFAVAFALSVLD